ncbi:MAG TPA: glucosaminidase domain-containing protein [Telluria sp.]
MRHADFSIAALPALAPTTATRPAAPLGNGGGSFGQVFSAVQGEVAAFIKHGDGASAATSLSPQGQALRVQSGEAAAAVAQAGSQAGAQAPAQQAFLDSIEPWAREAGQRLGVAPELVSAHAALESGWGQHPLLNSNGSSSHNLFGLKAVAAWKGDVAESATTEYVQGAAVKTSARFRSYPDQASAFRDYAQMLIDNPRFRGALGAGTDAHAFAQGLARGGYATDPAYADKLARLATRLQGSSDGGSE